MKDYEDEHVTGKPRGCGHFGTLAKCVNVWRAPTNSSRILDKWRQLYPDDPSMPKRLPPRALKGRWGSIEACEKHFINAGPVKCAAVFVEVFGMQSKAEPASWALVHIGDDEDKEYEVKAGRWIRGAVDGLNDKHFWTKTFLSSITRQPLVHFRHWLESGDSDSDSDDLFRSAPLESKQWQPLCNLEGLD